MSYAFLGNLLRAAVGGAVLAGWVGFWPAASVQAAAAPPERAIGVVSEQAVAGGQPEQRYVAVAAAQPAAGAGEQAPPGPPEQADGPPSRTLRVRGDAGVHPVDRQAACLEAEQNALQSLYEQLNSLAVELGSPRLSRRQLTVEHAWLLAQPGVVQTQKMDVQEKPHGPVAWQEITLRLPLTVLVRWSQRLQDLRAERTAWWIGGGVGTLLVWLVGFLLTGLVDRATGAYYRRALVLLMLLVLSVLTGLGWWWIATKTFDPPGPAHTWPPGPAQTRRLTAAHAETQAPWCHSCASRNPAPASPPAGEAG